MRLRTCAPTLLALVAASGFAAENDGRRDEHARAIRALIDVGARTPALRQIDIWAKSGYADTSPSLKQALLDVLDQNFDLKFDEARMKKYAVAGLPPIVAELTTGGAGLPAIVKILNDTRKILDPDAPPPQVKPTAEKMAALQRNFRQMLALFDREFAAAVAKVKDHAKAEDDMWELDEKRDKARIEKIQFDAVMMRIDALKIFYFSHMALREAALRGADFDLDPKPYQDALAAWAKTHYDTIAEWDYAWAEMHPQLAMFCAVAIGEAARSKARGASISEAEAGFFRVIDVDLEAVPAAAREAIRTVQANTWANLLRWRLELGTPDSYERGVALFNDFKKRYGKDKAWALTFTEDGERAIALGSLYITAGRLFAAKGDSSSASTLWTEVQSAKNPLYFQAKRWMTQGDGGSSDWGQDTLPADPGIALVMGRSLISEGNNANPEQAREYFLRAALGLRGGVLGLGTAAFEDQFVAQGPDVYRYYAYALSQLGMKHHAATVGLEGVRQVVMRIDAKTNPWKTAKGEWTTDGEKMNKLLQSALTYCSQLNSKTRTSAAKKLYEECAVLAEKVDPSLVGEGIKWAMVVGAYNEGRYEEAIEGARAFAKEYPAHFVKSASLLVKALQARVSKLDATPGATLDAAQKDLDDTLRKLEGWIGKQSDAIAAETDAKKAADKAAEIKPLRQAVISAKIRLKLNAGDYDAVFTDLGPEFWAGSRVDAELAISMLKYLAQAVREAHLKASGVVDFKNDKPKPMEAEALIAAWKRYEPVIKLWKKKAEQYCGDDITPLKNSSYGLASMAQIVSSQADQLAGKPGIAEVSEAARLTFADFIEPFVDASSAPSLILAVAQTLWDLNERGRAARLFGIYKASLDGDPMVQAYRADAAGTVDQFAETFTGRTETKGSWAEIRDLLVDAPGFLEDFKRLDPEAWKEKKRDYHQATTQIDALRKLIDSQGHIDAGTRAAMQEAAAKLRRLASNLAYTITIDGNLAQYFRETNQADKAVELYRKLYEEYDPRNPLFAEGYVEGVLQALASGAVLAEAVISQARDIAGENLRIFQRNPAQRDSYWTSYLQVFELSKYLGKAEIDAIKKSLEYTVKNKGTPRHDLVAPAVPGDSEGISRARNEQAVALAERYLELFTEVQLPKPFRVERISVAGKTISIFVDAQVAAVEGVVEATPDGDEIIILKAAAAPAAVAE